MCMLEDSLMQMPVPTGSNPLWLEKKGKESRLTKYVSGVSIIILIIAGIAVVQDYYNARDPNAFECNLGFRETGCAAGYKCVGGLVECKETGEKFKYPLTSLIFPEKKCKAAQIYREYCVKE